MTPTDDHLGQAIGIGLLQPRVISFPRARLADDLGISPVSLPSALTMLRGAGLVDDPTRARRCTFVTATPGVWRRSVTIRYRPGSVARSRRLPLRCEGGDAALAAERATFRSRSRTSWMLRPPRCAT